MSDITPADALRELRDGDYPDYVAAAAKKLGLPESVEYVEMRTVYGVHWRHADEWEECDSRADAEHLVKLYDRAAEANYGRVKVAAHEVITTAWREVRSKTEPKHVGGRVNAEDCPACAGLDLPYPWICPGDSAEDSP